MDTLQKAVRLFALIAFSLGVLGTMGGNGFIAAAHIAIVASLLGYVFLRFRGVKELGSGPRYVLAKGLPFRPSMVALAFILVSYFLSIVMNWESYDKPLKDIKKLRYEGIVLLLLLVPCFRGMLYRNQKLHKLGFWLAWIGVVGVAVAGLIGMKTGYHPLLMESPEYQTTLDGVSGTLMSYAYTLQFFVLLTASLLVDSIVGRDWAKRIIRPRWGRLIFLTATLIFITWALYLTYRRGPAVGVVVGGICLLVLARNMKLSIACAVLAMGALVIGYQTNARQFHNFSSNDGFELKTDNIRVSQWKTASVVFLENPVFGVGHRQFEKQCAKLKEKYGMEPDFEGSYYGSHAHNNFAEAFASNGFLGGFSLIAFCIFWVRELYRSKHAKLYFLPVVWAFIVSGFFENTFTDSEVLHTIMILYLFSQMALDAEMETGEKSNIQEGGKEIAPGI